MATPQIPDTRFIAATNLEEYFVDKDTGLPLAGGSVEFWQDTQRGIPKLVYELTGDPTTAGGYSFDPLPNPITLSNVGTIQDAGGNNVALYYFPYDGDAVTSQNTLQLYYIVVKDSLGNVQFTRPAWPPIAEDLTTLENAEGMSDNQVSNSQFVDVSFNPSAAFIISFSGNTTSTYNIAPDWRLAVTYNGAGTVSVLRTALAGSTFYPTNPPYWITITPGTNITRLLLFQNFSHNPGIWGKSTNNNDGFLAGSVLLGVGSGLTMTYVPSTGAATTILTSTNTSGIPAVASATVQLPQSNNPQTGDTGFVQLQLNLNTGAPTTFSSVQLVSLATNQDNVPYVQDSANRQMDHLFHYYNPLLRFKPIPSYLVGWDFPLNPAQFFGPSVPTQATGVNSSYYAWDQTIVFQQVNSAFNVGRSQYGELLIQPSLATTSGFALIQYLDGTQIKEILNTPLSVMVAADTNVVGGVNATVNLYYTSGQFLPSMAANQSLVASIDANGKVATFNNPTGTGTLVWNAIPLSQNNNTLVVQPTNSANTNYYPLSGWTTSGNVNLSTATYFAIVVGFAPITSGNSLSIQSISLTPGNIPTIPAPKTAGQTLSDCQQYYWKTYPLNTLPGATTTVGMLQFNGTITVSSGAANIIYSGASFVLRFPNYMRVPPSISIYSPITGAVGNLSKATNAGIGNVGDFPITNWTNSTSYGYVTNDKAFYLLNSGAIINFTAAPNLSEFIFVYHAVVDARLGIV